jgi:hypothetical protein
MLLVVLLLLPSLHNSFASQSFFSSDTAAAAGCGCGRDEVVEHTQQQIQKVEDKKRRLLYCVISCVGIGSV